MTTDYHPIACGLVDELHVRALRGTPVAIVTVDGGVTTTVRARITDVATRDGAEFATLDDGRSIRLDRLVSVDGVPFGGRC